MWSAMNGSRAQPLDSSSRSSIDEEEEETTVKFLGFSCSGKNYGIVHNRSSSSFHGEGNNGEVFFQKEAQKNVVVVEMSMLLGNTEIQSQRSLCLKKELFAAEIISEGGKEYLPEVACSSSGTHY
ncbi:unnamed protein product [Sphagnum troendelagicum]